MILRKLALCFCNAKEKGRTEQAAPFCSTNYPQSPIGFLDNVTCMLLPSMSLDRAAKNGPVVRFHLSVNLSLDARILPHPEPDTSKLFQEITRRAGILLCGLAPG